MEHLGDVASCAACPFCVKYLRIIVHNILIGIVEMTLL